MNTFVQKDSKGEKSLPLTDEKEFNEYLFRFISEDLDGIQQFRTLRLGFLDCKDPPTEDYPYDKCLQYMVIAALSIGDSRDSRELKLPIYLRWEETLAEFDKTAPPGLQNVY